MEIKTEITKHFDFFSALQQASGLIILILFATILSLLTENFLTIKNLSNITLQTSFVAIATIGMTMAMLTGGIDLSVGSIAALSGAIAAGLMSRNNLSVPSAIFICTLLGTILGLVNGLLTVYGRLPPFIATLATLSVARGFTLVYTEGKPIAGLSRIFTSLGTGTIGPFPIPVIVWFILLVIAYLILRYTRFGLYIYAIGGNEETVRLAGIKINQIKISVYCISGFLASMIGILLTARLWSAQPQMGTGFELDVIAAAVLGGVSLFGGVGNVIGASIGALIVGILGNGLNLLSVPSYYQQVIKGIVFILAVILDLYSKHQKK